MSEFGDLKKLRAILDSLTPPMVMVGRCQDCAYWLGHDGRFPCRFDDGICDCSISPAHDRPTSPSFGCTLWERKP